MSATAITTRDFKRLPIEDEQERIYEALDFVISEQEYILDDLKALSLKIAKKQTDGYDKLERTVMELFCEFYQEGINDQNETIKDIYDLSNYISYLADGY